MIAIYIIATTILTVVIATYITKPIRENINRVKAKIGVTIVYNKDTVMVTDYSMFNETYSLSNGQIISMELLDKLDSIN